MKPSIQPLHLCFLWRTWYVLRSEAFNITILSKSKYWFKFFQLNIFASGLCSQFHLIFLSTSCENFVQCIYSLFGKGSLNIISFAQNRNTELLQTAFFALEEYLVKVSLEESYNICNVPLWLNSNISTYPLCLKSWHNKGISILIYSKLLYTDI